MFGNNQFFKQPLLTVVLITFLAAILRFWHITSNPPSLYIDEVSHGYNAYSILKTGKDEYGTFMPFFFRSFNVYNPPFSVYTLVPSIRIFGLNELGVRFPAALFGTLFIPLTYFLTIHMFRDKKISLLSSLFIAISPWHIHFSRFYHEANFTVFFTSLGFMFFLLSRRIPWLMAISAVSYAIAINYSHGAKLFVPIFILGSTIFYFDVVKKNIKYFLILCTIIVVSITPYLLNAQKGFARASGVTIFSNSDVVNKFVGGYLSHYSPKFLFSRGDYQGRHSVPGMGELYIFQIPLVLFGLYILIKSKRRDLKFILFWVFIAAIPAAISTPTPHAGRMIFSLPTWSIISAFGLVYTINKFKTLAVAPVLLVAIYNIVTYLHLYHIHYPNEKAIDWGDGYKQMVLAVGERYNDYERIAITRYWGLPYIYVLFHLKFNPESYQTQAENKNAFDKFEFYLGAPAPSEKNTLFVSTAEHKDNILKEIRLNNGDLFFTVHE